MLAVFVGIGVPAEQVERQVNVGTESQGPRGRQGMGNVESVAGGRKRSARRAGVTFKEWQPQRPRTRCWLSRQMCFDKLQVSNRFSPDTLSV